MGKCDVREKERVTLNTPMLKQAGYDRTIYIFDGDFNMLGKHMWHRMMTAYMYQKTVIVG